MLDLILLARITPNVMFMAVIQICSSIRACSFHPSSCIENRAWLLTYDGYGEMGLAEALN